jgi:hypothetical protein
MTGSPPDIAPSGLAELLGEISSVVRTLDCQLPDATTQAVLSGYAAQVSALAAAKRSASRLPRGMRFHLRGVSHGLQILAGEVPGHNRGDRTADLRQVTEILTVCKRHADKLNLPQI